MKRTVAAIAVVILATVASAYGQQPAGPADPHHPQEQTPPPAEPGRQTAPTAPPSARMMPMDMCREMMSGGPSMMGPGMMGGQQTMDPRMATQMMEMRGEMMKAMGEIMLKHAKKMQGTPATAK